MRVLTPVNFSEFGMDEHLGFLPAVQPLHELGGEFSAWDEIARELPKALRVGNARRLLSQVQPLDPGKLQSGPELERAMLLLSYFAHGYIFDENPPAQSLPANLAVPWHQVAGLLGRPPILSYSTHVLHNWRLIDSEGPVLPENLERIQDFLGGMDDDWFVLVHVAIEASAGPGLRAMTRAQDSAAIGEFDAVAAELDWVSESLEAMSRILARMPERCDPYIYYNRVRLFMFGWANNPAFPEGLRYEGVTEYPEPQKFHGETGAQSAIIPFLGNALGIGHEADPLNDFMLALRAYIPPQHRAFIEDVGRRIDLRAAIRASGYGPAFTAYNTCIERLCAFHELHLRYAAQYVHKQGRASAANDTATGTGGTPFMKYLKLHLDNIAAHRLPQP